MAKRKRLILSPEADQDLIDIWGHLARGASPGIADEQLRRIDRSAERLLDHPFSAQARDELAPGIRSLPVHPYMLFFRVTSDAIEIVRVLHGSRDVEAIFRDEDR